MRHFRELREHVLQFRGQGSAGRADGVLVGDVLGDWLPCVAISAVTRACAFSAVNP